MRAREVCLLNEQRRWHLQRIYFVCVRDFKCVPIIDLKRIVENLLFWFLAIGNIGNRIFPESENRRSGQGKTAPLQVVTLLFGILNSDTVWAFWDEAIRNDAHFTKLSFFLRTHHGVKLKKLGPPNCINATLWTLRVGVARASTMLSRNALFTIVALALLTYADAQKYESYTLIPGVSTAPPLPASGLPASCRCEATHAMRAARRGSAERDLPSALVSVFPRGRNLSRTG